MLKLTLMHRCFIIILIIYKCICLEVVIINNPISITDKESRVIKMIARTGFYIEDYNKELGISKKIIRSCINKGLICKGHHIFFYKKLCQPYFLTDASSVLVKERFSISPYKFKTSQGNHDFVLGHIYLSLTEKERDSWITETALDMKYPGESIADGLFTSLNNNIVGVEVLTNNYTKSEVENKKRFIEKYCDLSMIINADTFRRSYEN